MISVGMSRANKPTEISGFCGVKLSPRALSTAVVVREWSVIGWEVIYYIVSTQVIYERREEG